MPTQANVNWDSVKNKIKHKWKKIEDEDIESMKGNLDMLSEKLQSVYSYPKTKADKEMHDFKSSIEQKPKRH